MKGNGYGNMMDSYGYNMIWGGSFGLISMLLLIVIAFVIYKYAAQGRLIRNINNDDALEILKQRYARGEIDEEQYNRMQDSISRKY